jgi:hypothetical protein
MFPLDLSAFNDAILAPFSESVTYVPISGSERPITANVQREGLQPIEGTESATAHTFTIHVRNNSTTGIAASELNTGGDAISVSDYKGGTLVTRRIRRVIDTDEGMHVLLVQ